MKRKSVVAAGALFVACGLLTGCGLEKIGGPTEQDEVAYEVTDKVTKLEIRSGSGDIVVNESDRSGVHVVESLHWRNNKPKTEHRVEGDTLVVTYECANSWGSCGVNYKVEIPKGLTVKADSGSGNVTLRSLTGPIEASAGSGNIEGTSLAAKKVVADAGSGTIELRHSTAPDSVALETGSGDSTVYLPQGAYDVTAEAGAGDITVKVTDDPASPRKVSITAGSGNVGVLLG